MHLLYMCAASVHTIVQWPTLLIPRVIVHVTCTKQQQGYNLASSPVFQCYILPFSACNIEKLGGPGDEARYNLQFPFFYTGLSK